MQWIGAKKRKFIGAYKVVQFGSHLQDNVLCPVPHRQYVFSIAKIIRRYFLYDRKLLGKLSQCTASCLTRFFRITLGKNLGIPGIALAIETFGDYAKWHPQVHPLVADGLFTETGYFYVMPKVNIRPLAELFRASVLKMLKDEGRLDDTLIKKILTWWHNSGFSVHNEVRIQAADAKGIENVAQYIIRNTFSLAKLSYIEKTGTVIYRSKMSHGGNKRNSQTYSLLEFIAAITQHIPERLAQMVRYYGWYSNRMRGDRQRATLLQDESEKTEAENYEVIKKILAHLGLSEEAKSKRKRAPPFPQTVETIIEPYDDGRSLRLPGLNMRRLSSMHRHYNRLVWDTVAKFQ